MPMNKSLLSLLTVTLLAACGNVTPSISVVCEENNVGNNIVKWETTSLTGNVKVFASTNPDYIPEENPVAIANIADQKVTIITSDPTQRYYYTLLFADRYRVKVATRNIYMLGIQNFRDLGGYPSYKHNKQTRWGMLYRSAQIDSIGYCTRQELKNIGIKTIVDMRTSDELNPSMPSLSNDFNIVRIPIPDGNLPQILQRVQNGRIKPDTIHNIVKRINQRLITNYTRQFRQVFDVLLDEDNYPVLIQCSSGSGRTGIMAALLMAALDIDEDVILNDYRLSNNYFDITHASRDAYQQPAYVQEAITALYSAQEEYLEAAKAEAEHRYGSVEAYLKKGIQLEKDEIRHLQKILLEKR